jgi:hypothetical protein
LDLEPNSYNVFAARLAYLASTFNFPYSTLLKGHVSDGVLIAARDAVIHAREDAKLKFDCVVIRVKLDPETTYYLENFASPWH